MTPKQKMLSAARGQMPDYIPFAPRIDLWFSATGCGAPVTEQYARSVGADAYGADAGQAAAKAKLLCGR